MNILEFTTGDIDGLLAYTYGLAGDFKVLILLAIGLPLGFWLIRKVITLVRAR